MYTGSGSGSRLLSVPQDDVVHGNLDASTGINSSSESITDSFTRASSIFALTGSALSFVTTGAVLIVFAYVKYRTRMPFGLRNHLIICLLLADFINSFNNTISGIKFVSTGSLHTGVRCTINGFVGQWTVQASDFFVLLMAIATYLSLTSSYRWACKHTWLQRHINLITTIPWIIGLTTAVIAQVATGYEPVIGNWCWIPVYPVAYRWVLTLGPRMVIIGVIFILYAVLMAQVNLAWKESRTNVLSTESFKSDGDENGASASARRRQQQQQQKRTFMQRIIRKLKHCLECCLLQRFRRLKSHRHQRRQRRQMRRYNQQMQRQQQNQQQNQQQGQQVPQLNLQQSTDPLNPQQQQQNIQQQHQLNAEDEPMSIAVTAVPSAAPTSSSSFTASGFGRSSGGSVDLSAMSGAAISNRVRDEAEQRVITIMRRLALYPIVYFVLHISSVIQRLTSSAGLDVPALKFLVGLAQYHGFANAILYSLTGSLRHTIADGFARLVPTQVMRRLSTNAMRRRRQSQLQQQQHQQHQQQMEMSQSQLEPGHTSVDIDMDQYAVGINDVNSLSLEQSGIIKQPGRPQLQYQHQHQIQNADGGSIQLNDYDKIAKSHENLGEMDDYYDDWVSPELRSEPTVPTSTVPIARRSMSVSQFHQRRSSHHHQQFQRPQHPQHPQQMYHDQTTTGGRRDRVTEILEEEGVESNRRHPIRRSSSESVTSRAGSSHQQDNDQHSTSRKDSAAETQKHDHQA